MNRIFSLLRFAFGVSRSPDVCEALAPISARFNFFYPAIAYPISLSFAYGKCLSKLSISTQKILG